MVALIFFFFFISTKDTFVLTLNVLLQKLKSLLFWKLNTMDLSFIFNLIIVEILLIFTL